MVALPVKAIPATGAYPKKARSFEMVDDGRLSQALRLMQDALQLLDEANAAPDVGAHLDLAICRLIATSVTTQPIEVAANIQLKVGVHI
jgi:hypothetical protein